MSDDFTFASIGRGPGRRNACPVCGQETAGSIQVNLLTRKAGKPKAVASRSKALCERHAVELFRRLDASVVEFLGGE